MFAMRLLILLKNFQDKLQLVSIESFCFRDAMRTMNKAVFYDDTLQRFPIRPSELDRFKSGKRKYFKIAALTQNSSPFSLDIACGAKPFPYANVLCDLHVRPVPDRRMKNLVTNGKPFVLCNCCFLPFKEKVFDFVTSYYLIEHIDDPWSLIKELRRVSKHGYLQCPSWLNELFYGEDVHYWLVIKRKDKLCVKHIKGYLHFGFIFNRLYKNKMWQVFHAIFDETFHLFTIEYSF